MKKLVVEIDKAGFFSNFNKVINHLRYSIEKPEYAGIEVDWNADNSGAPDYAKESSNDLWSELFEPLQVDRPYDSVVRTTGWADRSMTSLAAYYSLYTSGREWRREYNRVYREYIRLKAPIADEVDSIHARHMQGKHCIGVHFRNHSHSHENPVPIPDAGRFIEIVRKNLSTSRANVVFLATDVESAIQPFENAFRDCLLYRIGVARSRNHGRQIHTHPKPVGVLLARDVLIDCLLLARTDKFVHITSNVATAVGYINPDLEMIFADYDPGDPRGMQPLLERIEGVNTKRIEKNLFELSAPSVSLTMLVDEVSLSVLKLCDGTRTKPDVLDELRSLSNLSHVNRVELKGARALRKLSSSGFLRYGELATVNLARG